MNSESEPNGDTPRAAPRGQFQIGRVLKLVLPIALVLIGGAVFFGFFDGLKRIETWSRPALVPATGQVFYNGKPLAEGLVSVTPRGLPGAMGVLDSQGRFKLQTDLDGTRVDGAYPGEHVVTVVNFERQPGASPPKLKTPIVYSTAATSPLRITISPAADKNDFPIRLEGEPPPLTPAPPIPPSVKNDDAESAPKGDATPTKSKSTTPTNDAPPDADQP